MVKNSDFQNVQNIHNEFIKQNVHALCVTSYALIPNSIRSL